VVEVLTTPRFAQVAAAEAARLLAEASYAYVDVRSVEEFELGHVHGAFNVPWQLSGRMEPNSEFLAVIARTFTAESGLVVGCQMGQRSHVACELLAARGFRVVEHAGGFAGRRDPFGKLVEPGWERAGFAVSYDAEPGRSYEELCADAGVGV
jgi:rhodanese-related sulfurtransferase